MSRFLGAVLLIIGTCIGGGILALPLVTVGLNAGVILAILCGVWVVMTLSAVYIVDLNLNLPGNANMISMARASLGKVGVSLTWLIYLLLLYTLLCAYLEGGTDLIVGLLKLINIHINDTIATLTFFVIFALILAKGIRAVDWANRSLMAFKLPALLLLLFVLVPYQHIANLHLATNIIDPIDSIMPVVYSFGFAIIVPTLAVYLNKRHRAIKSAVLVGSLVPLLAYIIWIAAVQMSVPLSTLQVVATSSDTISGLATAMSDITSSTYIAFLAHFFTTICITTSFLGVSISLLDFLIDGMQVQQKGSFIPLSVMVVAFLPPLVIVLLKPGIFILLLKYAGTVCVLLLILLPTIMAWNACYVKKIIAKPPFYCHKVVLATNILIGVFLLYLAAKALF